jgi:hypothetical protein
MVLAEAPATIATVGRRSSRPAILEYRSMDRVAVARSIILAAEYGAVKYLGQRTLDVGAVVSAVMPVRSGVRVPAEARNTDCQ